MKKLQMVTIGILVLSFVIGICFYDQMPEKMASHWNASGQVDGYIPKFWALFLVPLISAGLLLLFLAIPKMDPLKANIEKFRKYYDFFIMFMIAFLFYIHLLTLFWNMGMEFDMIQAMSPAFGALLYCCGILIANTKQNWFIGIRTPWTMSSEKVWDKTHKIGGKLFKLAGIISVFGILLPYYAIFLILVPIILFSIYTVVYSYLEYEKEKR